MILQVKTVKHKYTFLFAGAVVDDVDDEIFLSIGDMIFCLYINSFSLARLEETEDIEWVYFNGDYYSKEERHELWEAIDDKI